jgi:hypothetical protein
MAFYAWFSGVKQQQQQDQTILKLNDVQRAHYHLVVCLSTLKGQVGGPCSDFHPVYPLSVRLSRLLIKFSCLLLLFVFMCVVRKTLPDDKFQNYFRIYYLDN